MNLIAYLKTTAKQLLGHQQARKPRLKAQRPKPASYEEQIYAAVVGEGDLCFDIGANRGDVAIFLARLAGSSGKIIAFEPAWPVYESLCANIQSDIYRKSPILTVPYGLAATESELSIQVPNGNYGMGSMAQAERWREAQSGATLDAFRALTNLPTPDFMKIDVEGAEWLVLQGAAGMFNAGVRPLMLIEIFAPWEQAFGYQPWTPLAWLLEQGYRFLFACPNGLVEHLPSSDKPFPPDYIQAYNIVAFVPEQHAGRIKNLESLRAGHRPKLFPMFPPPIPNVIDKA
ncbi:MAG: FkbM family methyltransferase [Rhizobacter sp.]|nr:FkbM family methyltransferase [Chlorobiales bacterium]